MLISTITRKKIIIMLISRKNIFERLKKKKMRFRSSLFYGLGSYLPEDNIVISHQSLTTSDFQILQIVSVSHNRDLRDIHSAEIVTNRILDQRFN